MTNGIETRMRLRDCNLRSLVVISPNATIVEAARRLRGAEVSSLLIGEPGCLVSIVTERDVVTAVAGGLSPDESIARISADCPFSISVDATLADAGADMIAHGVRHLVVADGDRAVGVIAMRDIVAVLLDSAVGSHAALAAVCGSVADRPEFWLG